MVAPYLNPTSPLTWAQLAKVVRTNGQACVVDRNNLVDPSGGALSVSLPASYDGDTVVLVSNSTTSTNNITIDGNGQTIDGETSVVMSGSRAVMAFVRNGEANEWSVALLPRELDGSSPGVRVFTMADLGVALAALGLGGGGGAASYLDIDANDQIVFRFQDFESATVLNLGALGAALDMTIVGGLNTAGKQGVPDGWFGKGLGFSMATNNFFSAKTAPHTPGWTAFTLATWFTPTRYVGASSFGRVFYKHYNAGTWAPPYMGVSQEYTGSPPTVMDQWLQTGPNGALTQIDAKFDQSFALPFTFKPQLFGLTYDGTNAKAYLNGRRVAANVAGGGALNLGVGEWTIGATLTSGFVEHAGGILHEARVCNVARDDTWWLNNWNAGMGRG